MLLTAIWMNPCQRIIRCILLVAINKGWLRTLLIPFVYILPSSSKTSAIRNRCCFGQVLEVTIAWTLWKRILLRCSWRFQIFSSIYRIFYLWGLICTPSLARKSRWWWLNEASFALSLLAKPFFVLHLWRILLKTTAVSVVVVLVSSTPHYLLYFMNLSI